MRAALFYAPNGPWQSENLYYKGDGDGTVVQSIADVLNEQPPNVKSFGAVGNGIADDTSALLQSIVAADGREIVISSGKYLIPSNLVIDAATHTGFDGVIIQGQGWDWTRRSADGSELLFSGAVGPLMTIQGNEALGTALNQIIVRDLSFRATNASLIGAMIRLNFVVNIVFENCNFEAVDFGTLIEGDEWVCVRFKHCRFRSAQYGVKPANVGSGGAFINVVKFEDCWFDQLGVAADLTYACQDVVFDHCVFEPAQSGDASPVLIGGKNAVMRDCWWGDANGVGTWVTATGEQIAIYDANCTTGAIGFDIAAVFNAVIQGGRIQGNTCGVKVRGKNVKVRDAHIVCFPENSVAVDVTAGSGHAMENNDIALSGSITGTIGYRLAVGTEGTLRDMSVTDVGVRIVNNSNLWNIDTKEFSNGGIYVKTDDDFLGLTISQQWAGLGGTDPAIILPVIEQFTSGVARMRCGANAAGSVATNGVQLSGATNWLAAKDRLSATFRVHTSITSNVAVFVGLTDQNAVLEMPFTLGAGDALTCTATNAIGVLYDTAADTDQWWMVGVSNGAPAIKQNSGFTPVADTYETWRVDIALNSGGATCNATFYRNEVKVGVEMVSAVGVGALLCPIVAAFSRTAASPIVRIDRIKVSQLR